MQRTKLLRWLRHCSFLMAAWLAAAPCRAGVTRYVSPAGNHIAPYTNWFLAATNIQAAVNICSNSDVVIVTAGVYQLESELVITSGITVCGWDEPTNTILQAGAGQRAVWLAHSNALLERFTITGGNTNQGSGIYVAAGAVSNCILKENRGRSTGFMEWAYGGGLFLGTGAIAEACLIYSNSAHYGGGVYLAGGVMRDCILRFNYASNAVDRDGVFGAAGGGVYVEGYGLVEQCTIYSNWARFFGGGVYLSSTGQVRRCDIRHNVAGPLGQEDASRVTHGGGVYGKAGGYLENCILYGNICGHGGGGAYLIGTGLVIHSSTVVSNESGDTSVADGQGNYSGLYIAPSATAYNCIIYYNYCWDTGREENCPTNQAGLYYSCTRPLPASGGSGNITNKPLFYDLARTNLQLTSHSACIDAGTNLYAPGCDIAGVSRPLDGNADGTPAYDMGAWEFASAIADTDSDGMSDAGEVIAGSDATNALDVFRVEATVVGSDHTLLSWCGASGRVYQVERKSSLADDWHAVPAYTNLAGESGTMSVTNYGVGETRVFYRVRVGRYR